MAQLKEAVELVRSSWKMDLPPIPDEANDPTALDALPIANSPGKLTKVGVLGALFLNAGGKVDEGTKAKMATLVDAFTAARIAVTSPLTATVLDDIVAYGNEYDSQVARAPSGILSRLAKVVASGQNQTSRAEVAELMKDPNSADPKTVDFAVFQRLKAAPASIKLYLIATELISKLPGGPGEVVCNPGPVKGTSISSNALPCTVCCNYWNSTQYQPNLMPPQYIYI